MTPAGLRPPQRVATARAHGLMVLTRNLRHFAATGVAALDPAAALPPEA